MNKKQSLDLTSGPIFKTLASLAMPIMASSFLATAYNITDMAWIGMLGSKAVAGVGVGGMFVWLSQGLVLFPRMGGQVNMAQCCGSRRFSEARSYAAAALQLTILFGILFGGVCLLFSDPLLSFFQMDDGETYHAAEIYMMITCGLIIFSYLTQTLTGLYTAQGDSKTPFKANLIGLIANMVLDPLLVLGYGPFPRLEAAGAAIATVIGNLCAVLYFLAVVLKRSRILSVSLRSWKIPPAYVGQILGIGIPAAIVNIMSSVSTVLINQFLLPYGNDKIAAMGIATKVSMIVLLVLTGLAFGGQPLFGYYFGAGDKERLSQLLKFCLRFISAVALALSALVFAFAPLLMRCFMSDETIVTQGALMLRWQVTSMVFVGIVLLMTIVFQSAGKVVGSFLLSIGRQGVIFLAVILIAYFTLGYRGVIVSQAAADFLTAIGACLLFYKQLYKDFRH
mgnify:CR=1 FL=1